MILWSLFCTFMKLYSQNIPIVLLQHFYFKAQMTIIACEPRSLDGYVSFKDFSALKLMNTKEIFT